MPAGPAPKGSAIVCTGLSKSFGKIEALRDLTLVIPRGVTFGLLGPNGAGKTTSIRLWLGLTAPTAGTAKVLGEPIPPRRVLPRIGYMPQDLAIYLDLTVEENLACFGRLVGMNEDAIDRRTAEVLKLVDIAERREDMASTLSGGMRRRASLAAALLHDPDLLLLDEPTVGVDPELRAAFWTFFRELTGRGKTVVITTHYMEEAAKCDLVGLLHQGRLLARDTPAAVKDGTGAANLDDAFLALVRGREGDAP
ncbi:MAG TPA: ABC transporter ATP-binding protein [Thermoplasmata archaeon]|nr:ABC transporter ATP-binding protein [Thermoplasmata archaeon]